MKTIALVAFLASCAAPDGTLDLDLTESPGAGLIAAIQRLRVTTTNPPAVFEADRTADGIDLSVELPSGSDNSLVLVEGFDATDTLLVSGQSPPFSLSGVDQHVVIFVAPPFSITPSPQMLASARADVAAVALPYGAILAGGRTEAGDLSDAVQAYNAYDHSLLFGDSMPVQRAGQTVAADESANVYLFGGTGPGGTATGTLHRFQTNIANGVYTELSGAEAGLERSDALALRVGASEWVITGAMPLRLTSVAVSARAEVPALTATGASSSPSAAGTRSVVALRDDGSLTDCADGIVLLTSTDATPLELPTLSGHAGSRVTALPDGGFLIAGDSTTAIVTSDNVTELPDTLSVPRIAPSVATTARHVIIAGGFDATNTLIPTADILDATTLERLGTIPYAGMPGAIAIAMPNDQVLFIGGDEPTEQLLLFTPPIPAPQ